MCRLSITKSVNAIVTMSVSKCVWTGYAWMSWNTSIQVNLILINRNTQFDYQALIIYNAFVDIKY